VSVVSVPPANKPISIAVHSTIRAVLSRNVIFRYFPIDLYAASNSPDETVNRDANVSAPSVRKYRNGRKLRDDRDDLRVQVGRDADATRSSDFDVFLDFNATRRGGRQISGARLLAPRIDRCIFKSPPVRKRARHISLLQRLPDAAQKESLCTE
jgi:hypothetical protein